MVYVSCKDNELNLWWDDRADKKDEMRYKIIVNGTNCVYTCSRYYDFKNLECGKEYVFQIQVVDKANNVIGRTEKIEAKTLSGRKRVDVTLPPYNALGDAKTDNTLIIQRAIDENPTSSEIYLPLGIYVCGKLYFKGSYNLRCDVGTQLISPSNL